MPRSTSKSPFPGMDAYVEGPRHWKGFHHRFIDDLSDAIDDRLPENYFARIEQDVLMVAHGDDELDKLVGPDVTVGRIAKSRPGTRLRSEGGTSVGRGLYLEKRGRLLREPVG